MFFKVYKLLYLKLMENLVKNLSYNSFCIQLESKGCLYYIGVYISKCMLYYNVKKKIRLVVDMGGVFLLYLYMLYNMILFKF